VNDNLAMFFEILDKNGRAVYIKTMPICYGIYPTQRWSEGEMITDNYNLLLPSKLEAGEYRINMLLFSRSSGGIIPVKKISKSAVVDEQRRLLLGVIKL
jgi:hypothetical protein